MTIFITATGTDVGKTHITLELLKEYASRGKRVAAIKPIETGVDGEPVDGTKLYKLSKKLNKDLEDISIDDVVPITFSLPAAPFIAKEEQSIDYDLIDKKIDKLRKLCDVLFIEGAGGAFVPIDEIKDMTYFAKLADKTLLITRDALGTISDTIAYSKLLDLNGVTHTTVVNLKNEKEFDKISRGYFNTLEDILYFPKDLKTI